MITTLFGFLIIAYLLCVLRVLPFVIRDLKLNYEADYLFSIDSLASILTLTVAPIIVGLAILMEIQTRLINKQ